LVKTFSITKGFIRELLQPFPRIRIFVKKMYQISIYYFFGYYDKCPWNSTGKYLLYFKTSFADRMPKPGESAEVGYINLNKNKNNLFKIAETKAWSWQQGCMLQWFKANNKDLIIYNDFREGKYISVISDLQGKVKKYYLYQFTL